MRKVRVGMLSCIRLENLIGQIQGWPRRITDRDSQNEINAARGGGNVFDLHGREVVGAGREVKSLRGKAIEGWVIAELILWLQAGWLAELVQVIEPDTRAESQAPKIKLQFKWWNPAMDATGELSPANLIKVYKGLQGKRLNIRGFFINEFNGEQFAAIILGPDLEHGELAPVRFDFRDSVLSISFVE